MVIFSITVGVLGFTANYSISTLRQFRFPYPGGDANHYRVLAEALVEKHAFVIPSGVPESDRTPGYPLFLAVFYALTRNWVLVAFWQSLLLALVPILTYFLANRFFGRTVGLLAGFLTAMDPNRLFNSSVLLSDGLFTLLFLASLVLFLKLGDELVKSPWSILAVGFILGYATLVRQVGLLLPLIFLFYLFLSKKVEPSDPYTLQYSEVLRGTKPRTESRKLIISQWLRRCLSDVWVKFPSLKLIVLLMGGFFLFVVPWSLRNKIVFNTWQLSPEGLRIAAYHHVPAFLEFKSGKPSQESKRELDRKLAEAGIWEESFGGEKIYLEYIRKNIRFRDLPAYMFFYAVKTTPFFLNDGLRDLARFLGFSSSTSFPNITTLILNGNFAELIKVLLHDWKNTSLLILGAGFMFLCLCLAAYGVFIFFRNRDPNRLLVFFLALLILYFALASGPVSNFRLRLPVMPLILILAVNGGYCFWTSLRVKKIPFLLRFPTLKINRNWLITLG